MHETRRSLGRLLLVAALSAGFAAAATVPPAGAETAPIHLRKTAKARVTGTLTEGDAAGSAATGQPVGPDPAGISGAGHRKTTAMAWDPTSDDAVTRDRAAVAGPVPATITNSFPGLNRPNSGAADPPDTIVGNSPNRVLEAVNRQLRLTDLLNNQLASVPLNTFFSVPVGNGLLFDPKVYFDRNSVNPRFYVVALQLAGDDDLDPANDVSRIHVAVSRAADPGNLAAANWCRYDFDGVDNVGSGNTWADFPGLGVGADSILISANQFKFTPGFDFSVALVRVLNKAVLANNSAACPLNPSMLVFQPAAVEGDADLFTLQPAQHYTSPTSFPGATNPAYLVNTLAAGSSEYFVWRIVNANGADPFMEGVVVPSSTYNVPPNAPGGAAGLIDTGDTRVLQVAGVANSISAVHSLACQMGVGALESCWRTVRFAVSQNASGELTVTQNQLQGLGFGDNSFYYYPGIAVNNSNETVVVWQASLSNNAHRVSSRLATKAANANFAASVPLVDGSCALAVGLDPNTGVHRAGDYVGAQTATDTDAFWVAAEHATMINGTCQWATQVARVTHP